MLRKPLSIGIVALLAILTSVTASAQFKTIPIGELTDSIRLRPKPALILISTNWCTYCAMQKAQLKKSREFREAGSYLYYSEFDAETKQELVFNGTTYRFAPTGTTTGSHELAFTLGNINNRLSFPTWVLINEHFEIVSRFPGVIKADDLAALLENVRRHLPVKISDGAIQKNLE